VTDLDGTYMGDEGAMAELNDNWQRQCAHSLPQVHTLTPTPTPTPTRGRTTPTPGRTHTWATTHMDAGVGVLGCRGVGVSGRQSALETDTRCRHPCGRMGRHRVSVSSAPLPQRHRSPLTLIGLF
jgi:hypothetical protein